jgi:flagellar protein FliO/FliZ
MMNAAGVFLDQTISVSKKISNIVLVCLLFLVLMPAYSQELLPKEKALEQSVLIEEKISDNKTQMVETNIKDDTGQKSLFLFKKESAKPIVQGVKTTQNADALTVSLVLIFILFLIFMLAWFMKKVGYSNFSTQSQLKIIATLNLGHKEKISIIQVGKQQLLVGMTATHINTLHVLDEPIEEADSNTIDSNIMASNTASFASKFSQILKNKYSH